MGYLGVEFVEYRLAETDVYATNAALDHAADAVLRLLNLGDLVEHARRGVEVARA